MKPKQEVDPLIGQVVMVTTGSHRGVFAGVLVERDRDKGRATLKGARMAVYWSPTMGGVLGLASKGPDSGCRIGPAAPVLELESVNACAVVSPQAWERWEAAPWSKS